MANLTIVTHVDAFDLTASLPERIGMFRSVGNGSRVIPLRMLKKAELDTDAYAWNQVFGKWPEMKTLATRLRRLGDARFGNGGIGFGLVFLEMLDAGTATEWQKPDDTDWLRVHLPLRTNPRALIFAEHECASLPPGQLTLVNQACWRCAVNWGEWPRIHLVADVRQKQQPDIVGS